MPGFPPMAWLLMGLVAAAAAIALLHIIAVRLRNDAEMRDLILRARELRRAHEERIAALRAGVRAEPASDVVIIDEDEDEHDATTAEDAPPPQRRRAA